ncbi:hypothetical protein SLEP1_g56251 [Rubroshorea leprosula]|uniref:Uncharacterized protein n=1 Tax=Rubroshorea leprosula TaxID=152421 RepID=A0AAV5MHY2_9ROSI|nr:hypothetical protein SLEP1_g56251 [Rubroshorea leprosula]
MVLSILEDCSHCSRHDHCLWALFTHTDGQQLTGI